MYGFDNTGLPYTIQGADINRDQYNLRLDHNFNANHKLFVVYTYERDHDMTDQAGIINWPGGYYGAGCPTGNFSCLGPRLYDMGR